MIPIRDQEEIICVHWALEKRHLPSYPPRSDRHRPWLLPQLTPINEITLIQHRLGADHHIRKITLQGDMEIPNPRASIRRTITQVRITSHTRITTPCPRIRLRLVDTELVHRGTMILIHVAKACYSLQPFELDTSKSDGG